MSEFFKVRFFMEKSGVLIADLHLQWLNLILEWMSLFEIVFISNILIWAFPRV